MCPQKDTVYPSTFAASFQKLYAANVTTSTLTAPTPTTTEPVGDGVFEMGQGPVPANSLHLAFVGTDAQNETFTALVVGWRKLGALWIPTPLLALTITLGTATGVEESGVIDTELFADTIAASTAHTSAYELISPANNGVAGVKVDLFGCQKVQVLLAVGTGASCNALAAGF